HVTLAGTSGGLCSIWAVDSQHINIYLYIEGLYRGASTMTGHDHSHDHHSAVSDNNQSNVLLAFVLTAGFMLLEFAGGLWSGSLALIADAGHMLTDASALALAWLAFRIGKRQADHR